MYDQNEAFQVVLARQFLISLEDSLEISSWPRLWTEHANVCQRVCCCSIATISRGGRSFGRGELVVASVFCLPCKSESKLSRPARTWPNSGLSSPSGERDILDGHCQTKPSHRLQDLPSRHQIDTRLALCKTLRPPHPIYLSLSMKLSLSSSFRLPRYSGPFVFPPCLISLPLYLSLHYISL